MSRSFNVLQAIDKWAIFFYIALVAFGWMNIYGASISEDQQSILDLNYRSGQQLMWIGISLTLSVVILFTDSRFLVSLPYLLYGLIILLLIVTVFVAKDIKGSRSWLPLGPFSIQPAEFSKFITALVLAKVMSHPQFKLNSIKNYAIVGSILLLPMLIIIAQSETGSALVYFSFIFMLYREGLPGLVPALAFCAVLLFIVVIRFSPIDLLDFEGASLGLFLGLLISYFIALIFLRVYQYERKQMLILTFVPIGVLMGAFAIYKWLIPFNLVYVMVALIMLGISYLLVLSFKSLRRSYLFVAIFLLGVSLYCFSAEYIFENVLQSHQQNRIQLLLGMTDDPAGIGYNINQARIAIGSGGLWGKGFLEGTQTKLKYVPEQDTDFIFCTIGEEWGFVGTVGVLFVYLLYVELLLLHKKQKLNFQKLLPKFLVIMFRQKRILYQILKL